MFICENSIYNITQIMCLYHQSHILHSLAVFRAGGDDINPRGIDAAVAEDIGELGDVLFQPVKRTGEQMPEIMREHLAGIDVRVPAQRFHLPPDIRAADGLAAAGDKDRACCDTLFLGVLQQLFL